MSDKVPGARGIGNNAVLKATGRSWQEWFRILDQFDRKTKGHKLTAKYLQSEHRLSGWWAQMVTVRYEWEHGLRAEQAHA